MKRKGKFRTFSNRALLVCASLTLCFANGSAGPGSRADEHLVDAYFQKGPAHKRGTRVDDLTFARRVWLDLTGRLPEMEDLERFMSDSSPDRRRKLIDEILETEAYIDRWTYFIEELFKSRLLVEGAGFRNPFHFNLRSLVALNTPWDEIATNILTDQGRGGRNGSSFTFWAMEGFEEDFRLDFLDDQAGFISETMLGMRINCISCHDGVGHLEEVNKGLTAMKREEFWGMAAFLSSTYFYLPGNGTNYQDNIPAIVRDIQLVDLDDPDFDTGTGFLVVDDSRFRNGEYLAQSMAGEGMRVPRNGSVVQPRYLFTGETPQPGETRRQALARMITADRQFARNMVNRLWAHFFGEGFVEPLEDWDLGRLNPEVAKAHNATVQPRDHALMELLTDLMIGYDYDLKAFFRLICNSDIYQLDYARMPEPGAEPGLAYWESNARVRRLEAEAVVDTFYQILQAPMRYTVTGQLHKTFSSVWELPDTYEPNIGAIYDENGRIRTGILQRLGYNNLDEYFFMQYGAMHLLDVFGRSDRGNQIVADREVGIQTSLAMMNDPLFHYFVFAVEESPVVLSYVFDLMNEMKAQADIVQELFLRILYRSPTPEEAAVFMGYFEGREAWESVPDMVWALFNHPDFLHK